MHLLLATLYVYQVVPRNGLGTSWCCCVTHLIGFPAVSDMACFEIACDAAGEAVSGGRARGRRA